MKLSTSFPTHYPQPHTKTKTTITISTHINKTYIHFTPHNYIYRYKKQTVYITTNNNYTYITYTTAQTHFYIAHTLITSSKHLFPRYLFLRYQISLVSSPTHNNESQNLQNPFPKIIIPIYSINRSSIGSHLFLLYSLFVFIPYSIALTILILFRTLPKLQFPVSLSLYTDILKINNI